MPDFSLIFPSPKSKFHSRIQFRSIWQKIFIEKERHCVSFVLSHSQAHHSRCSAIHKLIILGADAFVGLMLCQTQKKSLKQEKVLKRSSDKAQHLGVMYYAWANTTASSRRFTSSLFDCIHWMLSSADCATWRKDQKNLVTNGPSFKKKFRIY